MMLLWNRQFIDAVHRLLDDEAHAIEQVKALVLELYASRYAQARLARLRADQWPVTLSGFAGQFIIEYDADGLAIAFAGCLPSHRKHRCYLGAVTRSADDALTVTAPSTAAARGFVRDVIAACYELPRL